MDNNKKIPSGSKLSLEELLQLKKFEQPNEQFWKRFDIELQRKTLQSLVKSPSIKDRFLSLLPSFQEHAFFISDSSNCSSCNFYPIGFELLSKE
jgi:hypothetical protein